MNTKFDSTTAKNDVQLLFDEIGFVIDDNQYRDAISMVDMYHFYLRQHQVSGIHTSMWGRFIHKMEIEVPSIQTQR